MRLLHISLLGRSLEKAYKTNSFRSLQNITTVAVSSGALTLTSVLTSVLLNLANEYILKDSTTGVVTFVKAIGENDSDFQKVYHF